MEKNIYWRGKAYKTMVNRKKDMGKNIYWRGKAYKTTVNRKKDMGKNIYWRGKVYKTMVNKKKTWRKHLLKSGSLQNHGKQKKDMGKNIYWRGEAYTVQHKPNENLGCYWSESNLCSTSATPRDIVLFSRVNFNLTIYNNCMSRLLVKLYLHIIRNARIQWFYSRTNATKTIHV